MVYSKFEDSPFISALKQRKDLERFKENKCAVYALELFYGLDDPLNELSPAITAGGDDCKIDLLYINREQRSIVVIQAYEAEIFKKTAKGNKGADLAYAIGVLLSTPEEDIPIGIRPQVLEARDSIKNSEISMIHLWYLHNCPESKQIQQQMQPLLESGRSQLRQNFNEITDIDISLKEIGLETLDDYYKSSKNAILIESEFSLTSGSFGYLKKNDNWESFVTSVKGDWLSSLYKEYKDTLFSANVRGFMGANNKDKDKIINAGIQYSAQNEQKDFFVYNNGITALVYDYDIQLNEDNMTGVIKKIRGISIVNGAQTTGSLGSLMDLDLSNIEVGIRFIKCSNLHQIQAITRFNNSQNQVIPSDFRANDPIQRRLRESFRKIASAEYDGGLRGENKSENRSLRIDAHTAAQALIAWHGSPYDSYHKKTKIWDENELYSKAFNASITAYHLLFVFSLLEAINSYKEDLINKQKNRTIIEIELEVLSMLNERGSSFLIIHSIKKIMEIILEQNIKTTYGISFKEKLTRDECIDTWKSLIELLMHQFEPLKVGLSNRLSNQSLIDKASTDFSRNIGTLFAAIKKSMKGVNPYKEFVNNIKNL